MWTDSRIQVQLEEDGGGSTRQSWMETSGQGEDTQTTFCVHRTAIGIHCNRFNSNVLPTPVGPRTRHIFNLSQYL